MKTNIFINISPPIPYQAKFWFPSYGPKYQTKLQNSLICNILRKQQMMKFIFGMEIKVEVFYKSSTGMPKLPKIRSLHIAISPEKHGG